MQNALSTIFNKGDITGSGVCNLYYTPAVDFEYVSIPEHIQIYAHTSGENAHPTLIMMLLNDPEFNEVLSLMTHFGKHEKTNIPTITELHIRRQDDGNYDCWSLGEDNVPHEKLGTFEA